MWRYIFLQLLAIILICNESLATHEIIRLPLGLSPTFSHQHLYVQPSHQLVVYPQQHPPSMPQFYQAPQGLYIPHHPYSASRYIVQSTGGFYDPVVSYIQQQNPYPTSSFMNFNLRKKLLNQQPEIPNEKQSDTPTDSAVVINKSAMELHEDSQDTQEEEKPQEMPISSEDSMETTTMLDTMKEDTENEEDTTAMVPEMELKRDE